MGVEKKVKIMCFRSISENSVMRNFRGTSVTWKRQKQQSNKIDVTDSVTDLVIHDLFTDDSLI